MNIKPTSLLLALIAAPVSLSAAEPAGKDSLLLCALARAVECTSDGECTSANPDSHNVPRFVTVDFKNDVVYGDRPDGTEARSRFRSSFRSDDRAMVLGVENGRAWNILIGEDGELVFSASDIDRTYSLFGFCTLK